MKLIISLSLFLISCSEHYEYSVDARLVTYVNKFYTEANNRGVNPQKSNLKVSLGYIADNEGLTKYSTNWRGDVSSQIYVWINEDKFNDFNDTNPLWIESLVFHELGHGLLLRHHCDCKSIMNVTTENYRAYKYDSLLRKELLDELFH